MKSRYRLFEPAREFIRSQKLKNRREWDRYRKSGKMPDDIPQNPGRIYKEEWNSLDDWLGIALHKVRFKTFKEARDFVRKLKLKNEAEWNRYCESKKLPDDIPKNPRKTYKKEWKGLGNWLGTDVIAHQKKEFRSYDEAKEFVHKLGLESQPEWYRYCKSGQKPEDIPTHPDRTYKNKGWPFRNGWGEWVGSGNVSTQTKGWSISKVKELLKALIDSRIIYDFSEVRLYDLLNSKGVLNLGSVNRHEQLFKNFIEISRTAEGKKAIEDYANSDSEEPPNLSSNNEGEGEIKIATSPEELAGFVKGGSDPLDYGKISSPEQILRQTDFLESICVDEEKMQFQVNCSIQEFWKNAFKDEVNAVNTARLEGLNGNKFHDKVVEEFLSDYDAILKIRQALPKGYFFPSNPTLMQLYVAHKINTGPYFGNFSGTGAGKTLSAILASRLIDSKMTVVVCPNDVVEQWKNRIMESFPNSHVVTGKPAFNAVRDESKHQYLVLNYDKFSQDYSNNAILNLIKQKIDFLVLDEIHFVKQRDDANESQRHDRVSALRSYIRDKNNDAKVLAMSATPVINNIMEGRSQLELMTAKEYADIATTATIPNAVTLHQKLALLSIREKRTYANVIIHDDIKVEAQVEGITPEIIRELKRNPLSIEKILTPARIPEILKHIKGKTIIYTEYVTEIIEKLSKAVADAGYSYALYIGEDHSGLKRFLNRDRDKTVQVLIASRPISVGIDGLQEICNRLIINTLPWTNAQYEQLIGRLNRIGQTKEVDVFVIKAALGGYPYDELIKWKRIQFKRSLADCAVDGTLPKRNLVTPHQAAKAAVEWLERLERGEISTVTRRDLDVELSPVEIEQRVVRIGDFTKLNNQINKEKSETTFERMKKKPEEWIEYHRQFRERRKTWRLIPVEEIIKRIKELSPRWQIGDFGCGEAQIVQTFGKDRVHSFDFVAIDDKVSACDMRSVPLKDGELDVAVFSLSLMEVNWPDHIIEARRSLAKNGYLFIVETTKSLSTRLFKLRDSLKEQGFEIYSDEERGDFTFIEARRV